jgi:ATPase subunit of ABC transporter with duplicated ATPase domains
MSIDSNVNRYQSTGQSTQSINQYRIRSNQQQPIETNQYQHHQPNQKKKKKNRQRLASKAKKKKKKKKKKKENWGSKGGAKKKKKKKKKNKKKKKKKKTAPEPGTDSSGSGALSHIPRAIGPAGPETASVIRMCQHISSRVPMPPYTALVAAVVSYLLRNKEKIIIIIIIIIKKGAKTAVFSLFFVSE